MIITGYKGCPISGHQFEYIQGLTKSEYVENFRRKHGFRLFGYIKYDVVDFGSTDIFNLSDMIYDVDTFQPKGMIEAWHESCLESGEILKTYKDYCNER